MYIGIRHPVISSSSLLLSRGFYSIFMFPFLFPTTSTLCVPLTPLPLNGARRSFIRGGPGRQLLPLLQLHPPPLPLLQREVWLWTRSWRSFSAWMLVSIHSLLSCIKWTPVSAILPDGDASSSGTDEMSTWNFYPLSLVTKRGSSFGYESSHG